MYNNKNYVTADEAVSYIRSGSHIHLSSIASVPHVLIKALRERGDAGDVKKTYISITSILKGMLLIAHPNMPAFS